MFRWSCLGLAALVSGAMLWMVNDVRLEMKQAAQTANENLPLILERTKRSSETLMVLSDDIRQLRNLSGAADVARDKQMTVFADQVLDAIRDSDAQIGLMPKLIGSKLKELQPAEEWVAGARKEALWLLVRTKTKSDMLEKLCKNIYGSDWYIQMEGAEPEKLRDWINRTLQLEPAASED